MKNWEKLEQLDLRYRQARQQLALGLIQDVEIKIIRKDDKKVRSRASNRSLS